MPVAPPEEGIAVPAAPTAPQVESFAARAKSAVLAAGLGVLLLAGCDRPQRPGVDTAAIVDAIKADEIHWNADYKAADADRVAAHYAPDAVAMYPGAAAAVGAAAIRKANAEAFGDPKYAMSFASDRIEVARSGDLAVARGAYRETTTDPKSGQPVTATGTYVTVYKPNASGAWKAVWDINTPGAARSD